MKIDKQYERGELIRCTICNDNRLFVPIPACEYPSWKYIIPDKRIRIYSNDLFIFCERFSRNKSSNDFSQIKAIHLRSSSYIKIHRSWFEKIHG